MGDDDSDVREPRTDCMQEKRTHPRTTWTLWRSPASHGETGAAAIWRETSSGRGNGLSLWVKCCRDARAERLLGCALTARWRQTEYYSSCELDWTGCLTAGSDMRWHHRRRTVQGWTHEYPGFRMDHGLVRGDEVFNQRLVVIRASEWRRAKNRFTK